jgi:FxsC-like protein
MAYYDFFFSFSSIDWRPKQRDDLEALFRRIEAKLRELGHTDGGYFSPDSVHRGQRWEQALIEALQGSRVLVPVYSPNYFSKSVFCGKEWQVFAEREAENRSARRPSDVTAAEVILPILWTAPIKYPATVSELQNSHGADADVYRTRGLGYMLQAPSRFRNDIPEFIDRFGRELAAMLDTQGAKKMRTIPNWDALAPPFPKNYRQGLGYVRYVFLAGRDDQMRRVRAHVDAYGQYEDRRDWRPCFPDIEERAGDLAHAMARENNKEYEFVEARSVDELITRLNEAKALKNIVILVVDPWSLNLAEIEEFAQKFDAVDFPTSGVIVTWNDKDVETTSNYSSLQTKISGHFRGRRSRQEYFQERVTSPAELREALVAAFNSAHEKLLESGRIKSAGPGGASASLPSVHT